MIILKPIIFYPDNTGCEATWVDSIKSPDIEVPEVLATYDEEGNELTPGVPARVEEGDTTETRIKCHSYHPTQMDMLRADAFEFDTSLDEYEELLSGIENAYLNE